MSDVDGLAVSALLYGASVLLIAAGYRLTRDFLRTPAALLAIVSAAAASFLMVRHAPAGPVWTPEPWSGEQAQGKPVRLHAPMRQSSLLDEAQRPSYAKPLRIKAVKGGAAAEEDDGAPPANAADGSGSGSASGPRAVLAALLMPPARRPLRPLEITQDCPFCPEMVVVPAGSSIMGAADSDADATPAEKPARAVRFWPGFAIGRYEITVDEYRHFTRSTGKPEPSCLSRPPEALETERLPVTCITPADATAYAAWLRRMTGQPFRLPTAAEWEYAARAGMDEAVPGPASAQAVPVRVESSAANAWNIHGMSGNVAEIVASCWQASLADAIPDPEQGCRVRMIKDGASSELPKWQRPSARRPLDSAQASPSVGFRVVRDLR